MKWLMSAARYQQLTAHHQVLQQDGSVLKVLLLPDGRVVKLFWIKPRLSSSLIYPRSFRFCANARRLCRLDIATVKPGGSFFCPSKGLHGVIYPIVEGRALLDLNIRPEIRRRFAVFIAELHLKGIYFRSLHLGNVLYTRTKNFALIDIADMRFSGKPLSMQKRIRNFRHLFRVDEHRAKFVQFGLDVFVDEYLEACHLSAVQRESCRDDITDIFHGK